MDRRESVEEGHACLRQFCQISVGFYRISRGNEGACGGGSVFGFPAKS